ncbi:MAG: STAS domain-containing protein [Desulfovibrio sp.]|jgi:anti-anti-sigma regulatory factor|nr:STAS domain-containing protein [Desulfovibrio sp.]
MQRLLKQYRNDVGDVLAEADVHLLELEVVGERTDPELPGRLSRLVHGLRGSAGLLGLDGACRMARLLEAAFELARDGSLPLTASAVSALEGCMRALAGLSGVAEAEEGAESPAGDAPPEVVGQYPAVCVSGDPHALDRDDSPAGRALLRLVALLDEALPESLRGTARELLPVCDPDGHCLFDLHGIDVLRARRDGLYLYVVEFGGTDDLLRKDLSPLGLLAFLRKSGLVLDARFVPGADGAGPGMPGCGLHVLYASILEPDLVNTVFQVESARVHPIDVDGVRLGEPGWRRVPARNAAMAVMAVHMAPDADSIDDLMRQYDTAMRKLREDTMSSDTDDESRFSGTVVDPDAEERRLAELEAELAAGMDALALDADVDGERADDASRRALASLIGGMVGDDAAPGGSGMDVAAGDPDADLFVDSDIEPGQETVSDQFGPEGSGADRFDAEHPDTGASMVDEAAPAVPPVHAALPVIEDAGAAPVAAPVADSDADSAVDPDADLFADSGDAPDLSYLDAVLAERPDNGVALDLSAGPPSRTVAGFTVRAADGDASPQGGAKGVLVLSGEVTIERGADLREALLDVLESFAAVRIDMSGVTAADLTLVQLLQSAAVTARSRGVDLAATGPVSEAVAEAARRTGLDAPGIRRVGLEKLLLIECA